jgi:uncharacterized protein (DUF2336 family)
MTIVTMRARLTDADVRMLVKGVNDEDRGQAAYKICRCIDDVGLTPEERRHAEEIVRFMVRDVAVQVRRALAVAMKNSPSLPHDVALRLANDIDTVALPILQSSPVLSDTDLIAILQAASPNRQVAIAGRETLSPAVTETIAAVGVPAAVERALTNEGAQFNQAGLESALTRMSDRPAIVEAMVKRETLPLAITEKLINMVSGEMFDHLVNNHELPPQLAIDLATGARERTTLDLIEQAMRQRDLGRFVQQLHLQGRLTPSLVMRALCQGHMPFVEHAMAELAGIAHQRMWMMIHDSGPLGLKAAFDRAGLPARLFPPFRAAIDVFHQIDRHAETGDDMERFRLTMIERVLTLFQSVPRDDLDYLLEKLDALGERMVRAAG